MRPLVLIALVVLVVLGGCSSAPSQEDVDAAKRLRAAAESIQKDQESFEESLDKGDASLHILIERSARAVDTSDAATVERLNVALHAQRAFDDARTASRRIHQVASRIAVVADILEDAKSSDLDRDHAVAEVGHLEIDLKFAVREQRRALERVTKARAALQALPAPK